MSHVSTATDLWHLDAGALAAAIRERRVSSREVVDAHLDRIGEVNPQVNALRVVAAEQAAAAADEADRVLASGVAVGALHGVPVSIKENIDVAGGATTWGVAAMAGAIAPADAPAVGHLRAAGAIPLARGNMPDFALRWHTDNALAGATRNPWDAARTPGGSSGGEAVAVATGMAPLALGTDLGGSLRWPAQCTGIAALRPSHGRVPDAGLIPAPDTPLSIQLFNSVGPMARSVADLRRAFALICAPSPRDPWHVPAPVVGAPIAAPLSVAVLIPPDTAPPVAAGVRRAAAALEGAGYAVEEVAPPGVEQAAELWAQMLCDDLRVGWPAMEPLASAGARTFVSTILAATPESTAAQRTDAWTARQALAREWSLFQERHPLILAPVGLQGAFPAGADVASPEAAAAGLQAMRLVVAVNLLGLPSAAVPAGMGDDGLPQGVQIIGPRFREDLCLDAAEAVEAVAGRVTPIDPRR